MISFHASQMNCGAMASVAAGLVGFVALLAPHRCTAADVSVEKVASGLNGPSAIAIRPGGSDPGELFVAERGAGRVVKLSIGKTGQSIAVITGFAEPRGANGETGEAADAAGIESLLFLDPMRLAVAGGEGDGRPYLRLFEVGDSHRMLTAGDAKQNLEMPEGGEAAAIRGFRNLARTMPNDTVADVLIAAGETSRGPGGLWKIAVRANTLGEISPMFAKKPDRFRGSVGGIAIASPGYITIAAAADDSKRADTIRFVNPVDGRVVLQVRTGLKEIIGVAYSPVTGNLYAADGDAGAIYRIDDASTPGKPACKAAKIADVRHPTAIAFASEGTLFIATSDESSDGALYQLSGDL